MIRAGVAHETFITPIPIFPLKGKKTQGHEPYRNWNFALKREVFNIPERDTKFRT
jgi:hypothetical protein